MEREEMDRLVQKLHETSLKIVLDIDQYCKENGLTYYLSGGSCLGAARHKGFIPWDHDADLMMPREDYEKFLLHFEEAMGGKYGVGSLLTEKNWIRTYSKIWDTKTILKEKNISEMDRGVSIDIFAIDGLPTNAFLRKLYYQKTKVLSYFRYQLIRTSWGEHEPFRHVKKFFAQHWGERGSRFFSKWIDNSAKKYSFATSQYVGVSTACHYWDKETIEKKYMESAVYLPFEGKELPVVNGYEKYLTNLYGKDYMKLTKEFAEREMEQQYKYVDRWEIIFLDSDDTEREN